jgi:hypothetical protein
VDADVALVTEHHLVVVLSVGGVAHLTHHVVVVLDAQALLRLHGVAHVVMAMTLKLLHHHLHGDLVPVVISSPWSSRLHGDPVL